MRVKIPFKEQFKDRMLLGTKTFTSRTKRMGKPKDTFEAFGATFKIKDVLRMKLDTVAGFYEEEGCDSREDFIEIWKLIHPRNGFDPEQWVFVHEFERVE